ncbi:MAG TPA: hypothetical protein PLP83_11180 [Candidatus Aminicenantes bacterium]|nr:hypothetical protein [Candidatus Aminicenantes bacterium]
MPVVNLVFGRIVDTVLWPFQGLPPWFGLTAASLLTSLLMLEAYKLTSDQAAIRRAKDRIKAHLLEMRLYKDNMRASWGAQAGILKANLAYLAANLKPLAVMIVPLVLILARLGLWFDRAPLEPGRETLVKAKLAGAADPAALDLRLETPPFAEVSAPPVRIADEREVVWRIKALAAGRGRLTLRAGDRTAEKSLAVGGPELSKVSARASRGSFPDRVLYPGEPPLPDGAPVRSIEVIYPARRLAAFGLSVHWLAAYLVLSIAFGFALKGVFGVEI